MALVNLIKDSTATITHLDMILEEYLKSQASSTLPELMQSRIPTGVNIVSSRGYNSTSISHWMRRSGTVLTASQAPVQLDSLSFTDANGAVFDYLPVNRTINIDDLGAYPNSTQDSWAVIDLCLRKQRAGYRVTGSGTSYYHIKPIALRTGNVLDFGTHLYCDFKYGGGTLTEADAPSAKTPAGNDFTSVFAGKQAQFVFVHTPSQFTRRVTVQGIYSFCDTGVVPPSSIYAPFMNQVYITGSQFVGGLTGIDGRNWYTCGFKEVFFTGGAEATVGLNLTPIQNNIGSGTSCTFDRVGVLNFRYSMWLTELNYSTFINCYSEGTATKFVAQITRSHQLQFIGYGVENLTVTDGTGNLFRFVDSQCSIIGLGASYNVLLNGAAAFLISSTGAAGVPGSSLYIRDVLIAFAPGVTNWQWWQISDTAGAFSKVHFQGLRYMQTAIAPIASTPNKYTIYEDIQGTTECMYLPAEWDSHLRIANIRLWSAGAGLYQRANTDPTGITDGTAL